MIGQLRGKLLRKDSSQVLIDVNGVGYDVTIPFSTLFQIGDVGAPVSLLIHTNVREDALQLFGFASEAELGLFRQLIKVNGIGAKLAVTILSGIPADELAEAIRTGNVRRLTAVPGLGKKTADRILVELKDKLLTFGDGGPPSPPSPSASVRDDAMSALVNLGYRPREAERALESVLASDDLDASDLEGILKMTLKHLAR